MLNPKLLAVGLALIAVQCVLLPWVIVRRSGNVKLSEPVGYAPLWAPPTSAPYLDGGVEVDLSRLVAQLLGTTTLLGSLALVLHEKPRPATAPARGPNLPDIQAAPATPVAPPALEPVARVEPVAPPPAAPAPAAVAAPSLPQAPPVYTSGKRAQSTVHQAGEFRPLREDEVRPREQPPRRA